MLDHVDTCIVGGGAIGLGIARVLCKQSPSLFVLEQSPTFGQGISSRSSEVIHAGIYYPPDSLKSKLCIRGKALLYQYCELMNVPYQRCGKLIVANTESEIQALDKLKANAESAGLDDLLYWSEAETKKNEPFLSALSVLHSPSTGIVDSHGLMSAYLADVENSGGQLICNTFVESVKKQGENFLIQCKVDGDEYCFTSRIFVNAAGLGAQTLAANCEFIDSSEIPPLYLCKGSYLQYNAKNPFKHLIYPMPTPDGAGLGIHSTLDTGGQLKFGPDTEYIDTEDYLVSPNILEPSIEHIRAYFPEIKPEDVSLGYAGIRPKLQRRGEGVKDFVIESKGISGFVQLFGLESPGLTSSMAIGDYVAGLLGDCH